MAKSLINMQRFMCWDAGAEGCQATLTILCHSRLRVPVGKSLVYSPQSWLSGKLLLSGSGEIGWQEGKLSEQTRHSFPSVSGEGWTKHRASGLVELEGRFCTSNPSTWDFVAGLDYTVKCCLSTGLWMQLNGRNLKAYRKVDKCYRYSLIPPSRCNQPQSILPSSLHNMWVHLNEDFLEHFYIQIENVKEISKCQF